MPYVSYEESGRQEALSSIIKKAIMDPEDDMSLEGERKRHHLLSHVRSRNPKLGATGLELPWSDLDDLEDLVEGEIRDVINEYLNYGHDMEYELPLHPRR